MRRSPRLPAAARAAVALAAVTSILACAGAGGSAAPAANGGSAPEDGPVYPAEPVALVDLPEDERPTAVALLPDGAFAASYQRLERPEGGYTTSFGGVRFRALDGSAGVHADLGADENVSADAIALAPDGKRLAVARYDRVDLVPLDGGEIRSYPLHDPEDRSPSGLLARCSSPWQLVWGGGTIAARCAVGVPMVLLDVESGARALPVPRNDPDGATIVLLDLALSPDARTLAVLGTSDDYTGAPRSWVELRSLPDGALVRRLPLAQPYEDVALSPDGRRLAVSHPYWGLQLLDAADGKVLAEHAYAPDDGNRGSGDVLWSGDGERLYRVGRRRGVTVHDATDARVLGYLPAHPTEPENPMPPPADWPASLAARNGSLALTADERFLASIERSDFGRAVRIWRLPTNP